MQNTQSPKLKARVSSEWTEDYISVLQKGSYSQQLQSCHAPWVAVRISFNIAIMYSGQETIPNLPAGDTEAQRSPWWIVKQVLVVSQCSTCSTEWSETVRGPRSSGKLSCHSSHGFPSSVSPVANASLIGFESSLCLYWLGINLHISILNNSQIPLS